MSARYGYTGCSRCGQIFSIKDLVQVSVPPSFGDGSEGPAVPANLCEICIDTPAAVDDEFVDGIADLILAEIEESK